MHKNHKTIPCKNSHAGSTPALKMHVLTCINICSHVTSYMIIAKNTDKVSWK